MDVCARVRPLLIIDMEDLPGQLAMVQRGGFLCVLISDER